MPASAITMSETCTLSDIGLEPARFNPLWKVPLYLQEEMQPIKTLRALALELGLSLEPVRPSQFPPSGISGGVGGPLTARGADRESGITRLR